MPERTCEDCGFYSVENGVVNCYKSKHIADNKQAVDCSTFIERQYDDLEKQDPLTPEQHEWFLNNEAERKKLSIGIQGLRF